MGETKKNSKATSILKNNPLTSIVKGNIGIIVVLIIMCVAVALATDKFLTTNNIISVLRQISINTYIALGMTLIIILGHIDLSVGSTRFVILFRNFLQRKQTNWSTVSSPTTANWNTALQRSLP